MSFPVPDFEPLIAVIEIVFWGGVVVLSFAAGWIVGGICQK